ncbi:MAG: amidohydrolase family protein [Gammaproteobacteria bacterium]
MATTLIRGRQIVCKVEDRHSAVIVDDGAIVQTDGVVEAIGPYPELRREYASVRELGSANHVVLPGFVNSHHHVGLTPLQLGSPDYALELWFASRLSARRVDLYLDTLYSAFEMIESGITTVQHLHGWIPGGLETVRNAAGDVLRAYDDIGMRVSYSFALRDQNRLVYEPDEDFVRRLPDALQPTMREHFAAVSLTLDEQLELFRDLHATHQQASRRKIQLAPANLHWCTDGALEALQQHSQDHGVPMHMHLLETAYQKEYARRRTGTTAVSHLHEVGLLGPHLTLGHGVWLTERDIDLVAETGTRICHNCSSNLRLRSGVAALNEYAKRGVRVGIGLDEAGINDDRDMIQEMRMVLRMHRVPGMDDDVPTCPQVLQMATEHGAQTTPFGDHIGTLEPGRSADMVLVDWRQLAYPYLDQDIPVVDAVVQRAKSRGVDAVIIEGEVVYENGTFTRVSKEDILAQLAESLDRPDTAEEARRREFSQQVFPHVKQFYAGYLDAERRTPFYGSSSRT